MNTGGFSRSTVRMASSTVRESSLSSSDAHTLNSSRPPGFNTRRTSAKAPALSGKNMTPNWQTTVSNCSSVKGSVPASACCHCTSGTTRLPTSTIDGLRSVAMMAVSVSAVAIRRVTAPVPAAISKRVLGACACSRISMSSAYPSNNTGTRYFSYASALSFFQVLVCSAMGVDCCTSRHRNQQLVKEKGAKRKA